MPQNTLSDDQQDVVLRAVATLIGKKPEDVETIIIGEKPEDLDKQVTERITFLRREGKTAGKGELQKTANKKAKELFGLTLEDDPESIDDLLSAVKEKYKPEVDPNELTEEQVKTHPTFKALETTLREKDTKHEQALKDKEKELKGEIQYMKLEGKAIEALTTHGAVFGEDPKLEAVRKKMFLDELRGIEEVEGDGTTELWTEKDGKRVRIENDKLFPVSTDDYLKGLVEKHYTTKVTEQKTGPGVDPNEKSKGNRSGNGSFQHFKGEKPKNQEEVDKILMDRDKYSYVERQEVQTWWQEQQSK